MNSKTARKKTANDRKIDAYRDKSTYNYADIEYRVRVLLGFEDAHMLQWDGATDIFGEPYLNFWDANDILHFGDVLNDFLNRYYLENVDVVSRAIDVLSGVRSVFPQNASIVDPRIMMTYLSIEKRFYYDNIKSFLMMRRRICNRFYFCTIDDFFQVSQALVSGDFELMKTFVKYGISHDSFQFQDQLRFRKICIMLAWNTLGAPNGFFRNLPEYARRALRSQCQKLPKGYDSLLQEIPGVKRILLVKATLKVLHRQLKLPQRMKEGFVFPHMDYVGSLKLFLETSTEPYLTLREVEIYLQQAEEPPEVRDFKGGRPEMLSLVSKYFSTSELPYQPRTLQHLSRCRIRFEARKKGALPYIMSKLQIPTIIKTIILADDVDPEIIPEKK